MSAYGELDPMVEHGTQFACKGKREHIATVNTPNITYPGQHFKIIIPQGSTDHVIIPDTLKITVDLDLTSMDKTRTVVNNVGRTLVKKKVLRLGSKETEPGFYPSIFAYSCFLPKIQFFTVCTKIYFQHTFRL